MYSIFSILLLIFELRCTKFDGDLRKKVRAGAGGRQVRRGQCDRGIDWRSVRMHVFGCMCLDACVRVHVQTSVKMYVQMHVRPGAVCVSYRW